MKQPFDGLPLATFLREGTWDINPVRYDGTFDTKALRDLCYEIVTEARDALGSGILNFDNLKVALNDLDVTPQQTLSGFFTWVQNLLTVFDTLREGGTALDANNLPETYGSGLWVNAQHYPKAPASTFPGFSLGFTDISNVEVWEKEGDTFVRKPLSQAPDGRITLSEGKETILLRNTPTGLPTALRGGSSPAELQAVVLHVLRVLMDTGMRTTAMSREIPEELDIPGVVSPALDYFVRTGDFTGYSGVNRHLEETFTKQPAKKYIQRVYIPESTQMRHTAFTGARMYFLPDVGVSLDFNPGMAVPHTYHTSVPVGRSAVGKYHPIMITGDEEEVQGISYLHVASRSSVITRTEYEYESGLSTVRITDHGRDSGTVAPWALVGESQVSLDDVSAVTFTWGTNAHDVPFMTAKTRKHYRDTYGNRFPNDTVLSLNGFLFRRLEPGTVPPVEQTMRLTLYPQEGSAVWESVTGETIPLSTTDTVYLEDSFGGYMGVRLGFWDVWRFPQGVTPYFDPTVYHVKNWYALWTMGDLEDIDSDSPESFIESVRGAIPPDPRVAVLESDLKNAQSSLTDANNQVASLTHTVQEVRQANSDLQDQVQSLNIQLQQALASGGGNEVQATDNSLLLEPPSTSTAASVFRKVSLEGYSGEPVNWRNLLRNIQPGPGNSRFPIVCILATRRMPIVAWDYNADTLSGYQAGNSEHVYPARVDYRNLYDHYGFGLAVEFLDARNSKALNPFDHALQALRQAFTSSYRDPSVAEMQSWCKQHNARVHLAFYPFKSPDGDDWSYTYRFYGDDVIFINPPSEVT